jgi:norsolorinic acid ketoreductase
MLILRSWVKTEMGNSLAKSLGMAEAELTIDDSVTGILKQVDEATRASSGKFINEKGEPIPW